MPTIVGRDPFTKVCIAVQTEGEFITRIDEVEETTACWIAPGFVDLQVNGYRSIDLNAVSSNADSVRRLTLLLAADGTTTYLPTIITSSHADMLARVLAISAARARCIPRCGTQYPQFTWKARHFLRSMDTAGHTLCPIFVRLPLPSSMSCRRQQPAAFGW